MSEKTKTPQLHISTTGEFGMILEHLSSKWGIGKSSIIRMAVKVLYDQEQATSEGPPTYLLAMPYPHKPTPDKDAAPKTT